MTSSPVQAASPAIVAFGGGTGLPVLLAGLREGDARVTAVVTVADDGGSSGRLRDELGIAPPGDVRNCLVALAGRRRLAEVFDYRFDTGVDLRDHTVGNIIIAALSDMSGGFGEGVERAGRFLRIRGRVLPAATESLTLVLTHADGTVTRGESALDGATAPVSSVAAEPRGARAPAEVVAAIRAADLVVLGPGSLFTSTIAALLGRGIGEALAAFAGPVLYVANLMTQPGETTGFTVADHVHAIADHVGPVVTDVLVDPERPPEAIVGRYRAEGAEPVPVDRAAIAALGVRVREASVLGEPRGHEVRHDAERLARAVDAIAREAAAVR